MAWTASIVFTTGRIMTSGTWNTQVVDNLVHLGVAHDHKGDVGAGDGGALVWPFCLLRKSAVQSLVNDTDTALTWDIEISDVDDMHVPPDLPTIVIARPAVYLCWVHLEWGINSTGYRKASLLVGGTAVANHYSPADGTTNPTNEIVYCAPFIASQAIVVHARQTSGGNLDVMNRTVAAQFGVAMIGDS